MERPKARACGSINLRVVRGPNGQNRWYWRATTRHDGKEVTLWAGWAFPEEAEQEAGKILANGGEKVDVKPDRADTVVDLLEFWLARQRARADLSPHTVVGQKIAARQIVRCIGNVKLDRLNRTTLENFRDTRIRENAATSSIRQELVAMKAAWRWGRELGLTPEFELPQVRLVVKPSPKRLHSTPSAGDLAAIVRELEGWHSLIVHLFAATGARLGELDHLTWKQVDFRRGLLKVCGKTKERSIPLSPPILTRLQQWFDQCGGGPEDPVWPRSAHTARSELRRVIKRACLRLGIEPFSPHGIRRSAVDALYRSGADIGAASSILGHSATVALQHYRRSSESDNRAAMQLSRLGYLPEGQVIVLAERA